MTNCKIGKEDRKMARDFIFSWAENADGRMVHVDDVPRGLQCGCVCPNCREKLVARHCDVKEHGFAHHSDNRGANLNICYQVVMYKLAEQIIQTRKRIHLPSYYGIFRERDVEFKDVRIDSRYEREDKQPDVIATTNDDKQYLIEFVFLYKVQHKHPLWRMTDKRCHHDEQFIFSGISLLDTIDESYMFWHCLLQIIRTFITSLQ